MKPKNLRVDPIRIGDGVLLYERRDHAELVFTATTPTSTATINRSIPWTLLMESARRCQPNLFLK